MLMAVLELAEGLLQTAVGRSRSSGLLTLLLPLSSDPGNCCKPAAVEASRNSRAERVLMPGAHPETGTQ